MTSPPPFELPEWRQELPGENAVLEAILGKSFKDQFANIDKLKEMKEDVVMTYLPLILAHLVETAASVEDLELFKVRCEYVKSFMCNFRPTKLRFLLLTCLARHRKMWDLKLIYKSDAYPANARSLALLETKMTEVSERSIGLTSAMSLEAMLEVSVDELLQNEETLRKWTRAVFFNPTIGIERKNHMVGIRNVPNSFSEADAETFIVEKLQVRLVVASKVGSRMVELGLIVSATKFPATRKFGSGKNYFQSSMPDDNESGSTGIVRGNLQVIVPGNSQAKPERENYGISNNNLDTVKITTTVFVDMLDVQSLTFWRERIWANKLGKTSRIYCVCD